MNVSDDAAPGERREPLSVDQAVEILAGPEAGCEDDEAGETAPPEPSGVEPPHFWGAEDKAAFAELPPHLQEKVAAYEKNRDTATARAIQQAAEARNEAQARASAAGELSSRLETVLPQAEAAFAARWGPREPDWTAVAAERGPEEALRLKGEFDHERTALHQLGAARAQAQAAQFDAYVAGEFETLKGLAPELAEGRTGAERRLAVTRFLEGHGVPREQIRHIGAVEMALAYDAMRYRMAQSALGNPARGRGSRSTLAPGAGQAPRATQARRAEGARSRFAEKPTIDNAVAAILAKG